MFYNNLNKHDYKGNDVRREVAHSKSLYKYHKFFKAGTVAYNVCGLIAAFRLI